MNDDIKNFTDNSGDSKRTLRGHLRSVATGDQLEEPVTVEVAPDSMGGFDAAAMLRADAEPMATEAPESEAIHDGAESASERLSAAEHTPSLDERGERVDDFEDFELPYADGSTTAPKPAKRDLFRKRRTTVSADHELEAAIAATTTDVWAAHRTDRVQSDPDQASDQPTEMLTASKGYDPSQRRRPLALIAVGAIVVGALAGASTVAFGGGGGGGNAQGPRRATTSRAKAHHKTHTPALAKLSVRLKPEHKAKHKTTDNRTVSHSTVTTSTVTSTGAVSSPPAATQAPAVTRTPAVTSTSNVTTSSTGAPQTSTPPTTSRGSSTHSSSSTSGGLPDLQQTAQQP